MCDAFVLVTLAEPFALFAVSTAAARSALRKSNGHIQRAMKLLRDPEVGGAPRTFAFPCLRRRIYFPCVPFIEDAMVNA
jgi:hypothetical protein